MLLTGVGNTPLDDNLMIAEISICDNDLIRVIIQNADTEVTETIFIPGSNAEPGDFKGRAYMLKAEAVELLSYREKVTKHRTHTAFTREEVEALIDGVDAHGIGKWEKVSSPSDSYFCVLVVALLFHISTVGLVSMPLVRWDLYCTSL